MEEEYVKISLERYDRLKEMQAKILSATGEVSTSRAVHETVLQSKMQVAEDLIDIMYHLAHAIDMAGYKPPVGRTPEKIIDALNMRMFARGYKVSVVTDPNNPKLHVKVIEVPWT